MFLDSFLKLSGLEGRDISGCIAKLEALGEKYKLTFVISISMGIDELPESLKKNVAVSL